MGIFKQHKQSPAPPRPRGRIGVIHYDGETSWGGVVAIVVEVEETEIVGRYSRLKVLKVSGTQNARQHREAVAMIPDLLPTDEIEWIKEAEVIK